MTALESELAAERGGAKTQQVLAAELDTLRAQVRAATGELEQDRAALLEVGAALERLRARVTPAPAAALEPVPTAREEAPPRTDAGLAMVLVVGAGLALIVALVLLLGGRSRRPVHTVSPAPEVEAVERVAEPSVAPEASAPPAPERWSCDVMSQPAGAELRRDGVVLGKTPLRISLQRDDDVSGYVLHRNGYHDVALELTPEPDCELEVVLQQQGPK
ncbi:MAG: hypothetical protein IT370_15230 [Deltaproteobacteria bacterium]|nr:hypothetical protein [Deltaproteobacteria bacterium]